MFLFFSLTSTTQYTEFFFFLPHCQNVYDIAGSFSHALYSRMVDQTKKMASVVGSFEAFFFSPLTIARHLLKSRIEGNESGEYSTAEKSGH